MPELPEVETIRLGLQKYLVGQRIEKLEVRLPKIFQGSAKQIEGAKIIGVRRFGKGLVIDLSNNYSLAIHIKLTGQLIYRGPETAKVVNVSKEKIGGELPNKWTHVIFKLDKNSFLYYNDLRQFGWIKIVKTDDVKNLPFFKELGPEPPVAASIGVQPLTQELFEGVIKSSNVAIKPLLMDQKKIGGIGNIYANDALFDARIDPRRRAKTLSDEEIKILYDSILKVLKLGLKEGGATEVNFVNALGQEGGYQNHFLVYGREGEKCKRCGETIKKIKLGGRGSYFCPVCQK